MQIDLTTVDGFRAIGNLMLQPPVNSQTGWIEGSLNSISLRQLGMRHRFSPGEPLSFREIRRRWRADEGSKIISVLSYNTFLMDITINVFEVLDELLPGGGFFESIVGAVLGFVEGGVGGAIAGGLAGMKVSAAREALEESAGKLLAVKTPNPATKERASELGAMLVKEQFDLAVLMEVWALAERTLVLEAIAGAGGALNGIAHGALPGEANEGSGLMTIGLNASVGEHLFFPYSHQGAADQDTDHYAKKGVLLARIPVGFGEIDFYSTHLYYGDDLPETPATSKPTNEQRRGWRKLQLAELKALIKATHKTGNVAMLAGDFNIDEWKQGDYLGFAELNAVAADLGLDDKWSLQFRFPSSPDPATPIVSFPPRSGTDNASLTNPFTTVPTPIVLLSDTGARVDYLLVERPKAAHTFNVDVTRIRLLDFPRPVATEGQATLSDHRGLAYSLLCSKKQ